MSWNATDSAAMDYINIEYSASADGGGIEGIYAHFTPPPDAVGTSFTINLVFSDNHPTNPKTIIHQIEITVVQSAAENVEDPFATLND